MGSTLALTDATGALRTQYAYEPFGNTTYSGEDTSNAFQYTGRENDGTGLYYYRARYYSPPLHRFISEDPLGLGGGPNLYEYAHNSPTNFNDPSGMLPPWVAAAAAICAKGAILGLIWEMLGGRKPTWKTAVVGCLEDLFSMGLGKLFKAMKGGMKYGDDVVSAIHGNSLKTPKPAVGYSLRDRVTGNVLKYGETTRPGYRYSQNYLNQHNAWFVIEASGTKYDMHYWQHHKILDYKLHNGGKRPPMNHNDWD